MHCDFRGLTGSDHLLLLGGPVAAYPRQLKESRRTFRVRNL